MACGHWQTETTPQSFAMSLILLQSHKAWTGTSKRITKLSRRECVKLHSHNRMCPLFTLSCLRPLGSWLFVLIFQFYPFTLIYLLLFQGTKGSRTLVSAHRASSASFSLLTVPLIVPAGFLTICKGEEDTATTLALPCIQPEKKCVTLTRFICSL